MSKDSLRGGYTTKSIITLVIAFLLFQMFIAPKIENAKSNVESDLELSQVKKCISSMSDRYVLRHIEEPNVFDCRDLKCFAIDIGQSNRDGKIKLYEKDDTPEFCYTDSGAFENAEIEGLVDTETKSKEYNLEDKKLLNFDKVDI